MLNVSKKNLIVVTVAFVVALAGVAQASIIYSNDFETSAGSEWSNTTISTTPGTAQHAADDFLGEFSNQTVSLSLANLQAHASLTISFDVYVIRSWDGTDTTPGHGPDVWNLVVNGGAMLLNTTFSNTQSSQNYPDSAGSGITHAARTGASESNTLGYGGNFGDTVYSLSYTFTHTADSVQLDFSASGLQAIGDESWGIDNVVVTPEPATMSLLGIGGLLALVRRRRK